MPPCVRASCCPTAVAVAPALPPALSEEEAAVGMVALCLAHADSDLVIESKEVEGPEAITVKTLPCRIEVMERLNEDVMLLKLKLPESERLQFLAGQYIQILLKDGRKRSFSLANAPEKDDLLELHIRHIEGGEFTTEVFDKMKVGDILRIEGPHGQFYLREDSPRDILFMAGGTGFAPIKGMIEHALDIGLERPMTLYWGVRDRNPELSGFDVYAAGPPPMVEAGKQEFPRHGLDLEHYYSDAFEFQRK